MAPILKEYRQSNDWKTAGKKIYRYSSAVNIYDQGKHGQISAAGFRVLTMGVRHDYPFGDDYGKYLHTGPGGDREEREREFIKCVDFLISLSKDLQYGN